MAISNGVQCPQLNSGLGTSHGWLSSMWIERSDTLIHALGYNTTLFAGQSEGWYVLILVPKKLEDFETFNAVLKRGARRGINLKSCIMPIFLQEPLKHIKVDHDPTPMVNSSCSRCYLNLCWYCPSLSLTNPCCLKLD